MEEFVGHVYIGEYLEVGTPAGLGACLLLIAGLLFQSAYVVALLEVEVVLEAIAYDLDVHELRGELRRAQTESVQSERELVAVAARVVLSACVELAVDELPVIALLGVVEVDGAAASEVLDLNVVVAEMGYHYLAAEARSRLVYGVGDDLEDRVLAAVETVRAEYYRGALSDSVRALEHGDTVVAVVLLFCHDIISSVQADAPFAADKNNL